jgi:endonuclease/exonuclease/phosphatase family metal-dependent hydrolase
MFKVMTWNVENLFRFGESGGPTSQEAFDTKLDGLARTIEAQAPDVLSLQEVGSPGALDDLVGRLSGTWERQLSSHPDGRHIRVVWLSRQPIQDVEDIRPFPAELHAVQSDDTAGTVGAMGRGALAITVELGGAPVRLVTAHLKSKLLEFPGGRFNPHDEDERARFAAYALYRRTGEAATLRVAVTATLAGDGQDNALVLTGDLNDTVQAATTQMLLGPPGSEIGTRGFDTPDHGDAQRLWNLAPLMPEGRDYSRVNAGRKELIDHVLVSAALVRRVSAVEAVIDQPLPSVGADPTARRNAPSSDHAPVVATFDA